MLAVVLSPLSHQEKAELLVSGVEGLDLKNPLTSEFNIIPRRGLCTRA